LTTVFSQAVLNEARFLGGTSSFDQNGRSSRVGVEHPTGTFGGNVLASQNRGETRFQFVDNVTFQTGDHTFKVGADVTRSRTRVETGFNRSGSFIYGTTRGSSRATATGSTTPT